MLEGEEEPEESLMTLRGGTAPFQIETGQWRGIPREERMCRECEGYEEVEDCNHWLLRCPQWASDRQLLLTKVEEKLRNSASLTAICCNHRLSLQRL